MDNEGLGRKEWLVRREEGFTLIELLVVILIIAILAAIAIPMFLRQRDKAREAQVHSALKNAATAVESYYLDYGSYGGLNSDPQLQTKLEAQGFPWPAWALSPGTLAVKSNATTYCIETRHADLSSSNEWYEATYESGIGKPQATLDSCP
jgi:type IV pilus assembly protein PilA